MITRKRNPVLVKKAQDHTRYLLKSGKLFLPDICYFCHRPGCDEIHHIDYSDANRVARVHKKCHRVHHNKDRVEKYSITPDNPDGFRIA